MKLALIAAVQLIVIVALARGAAVLPATAETADDNEIEGAERTGKALSSRTMGPVLFPFETLSNQLAVMKKPWKIDQFSLEKVKDFALTHKGAIVWVAVAAVAVVAIALIASFFTGFDGVVRSFAAGMDTVKARASDMGLQLDAEHLNLATSRIFQAIDSWEREHLKYE